MKFKLSSYFLVALLALVAVSCKDKDDDVKNEGTNKAPTMPILKAPKANAENVLLNPVFKWEASTDPDKDEVRYELLVSKDKDFSKQATKKAIDIKETSYSFTNYQLENLTTYYWKVVAYDTKKAKKESAVSSFKTIGVDLTISLTAPLDEAKLTAKDVELTWKAERNPLYKGEVTYSVFLRNGSTSFGQPAKKGLTETKAVFNGLKGNGHYYWSVVALDKGGNEVVKSPIFSFFTPNTLPSAPVLSINPSQTEEEDGINVSILWLASKDEDRILDEGKLRPEKLTYDIYLSTDDSFTDEDIKKSGFETTEKKPTYLFTKLPFETEYWVKVVVKDENGGVVDSNVIKFTTKKKTVTESFTAVEGTWTDTRDSKTYKTMTINGKTWLAENFAYLPFVEQADDNGDKMTCSVYGESSQDIPTLKASANYAKYGVLYSGYALPEIVPAGWHVATDEDWQELEKLSGMTEQEANTTGYKNGRRGATMHKFIKEGLPYEKDALKPTDEMKISIIYGGYLANNWQGIQSKGEDVFTYFWTSTEYSYLGTKGLYCRAFRKDRDAIERDGKGEKIGMYVRLVKD